MILVFALALAADAAPPSTAADRPSSSAAGDRRDDPTSAAASQPRRLDEDALERIAFIQQRLDAGTRGAAIYWYTWLSGYCVLTVAQVLGAVFIKDPELRGNLIVGGASTVLGILSLAVLPLPAVWAADKLRRAPQNDDAQARAKLALGENLLADSAEAEAFTRSWLAHAAGALVSVAQGLIMWLAFKLPVDGVVNGVISLHVAEAQIFTQPINAVIDWKEYQKRYHVTAPASQPVGVRFMAYPGGLGLAGAF